MKKIKVSYEELKKYLTLPTPALLNHLGVKFGKKGYVYIDNNSKILGVAHLDIVGDIEKSHCDIFKSSGVVFSRALDDRLGVFILMNILPKLGINLDILLTNYEEIGLSTARYFESSKTYNWLVEWDRGGEDVVVYQYKKFQKILSEYFTVGYGTYSDIVELPHLNALGVNIGIGYYNEHTQNCFCDIAQTERQLNRFISFYADNKDKRFEYSKRANSPKAYSWGKSIIRK